LAFVSSDECALEKTTERLKISKNEKKGHTFGYVSLQLCENLPNKLLKFIKVILYFYIINYFY